PELVLKPTLQLRIALRTRAVAFAQTASAKLTQHRLARRAKRNRILWVFRFPELELHVTAVPDLERVSDCLGQLSEERTPLRRRLDIQRRHVAHPSLAIHHLARADAKHHIVRPVILPLKKMDIVSRHQPQAQFTCQSRQHEITFPLFAKTVIMQLDEEILLAK